jgi:hypothetical protein
MRRRNFLTKRTAAISTGSDQNPSRSRSREINCISRSAARRAVPTLSDATLRLTNSSENEMRSSRARSSIHGSLSTLSNPESWSTAPPHSARVRGGRYPYFSMHSS